MVSEQRLLALILMMFPIASMGQIPDFDINSATMMKVSLNRSCRAEAGENEDSMGRICDCTVDRLFRGYDTPFDVMAATLTGAHFQNYARELTACAELEAMGRLPEGQQRAPMTPEQQAEAIEKVERQRARLEASTEERRRNLEIQRLTNYLWTQPTVHIYLQVSVDEISGARNSVFPGLSIHEPATLMVALDTMSFPGGDVWRYGRGSAMDMVLVAGFDQLGSSDFPTRSIQDVLVARQNDLDHLRLQIRTEIRGTRNQYFDLSVSIDQATLYAAGVSSVADLERNIAFIDVSELPEDRRRFELSYSKDGNPLQLAGAITSVEFVASTESFRSLFLE